MTDNLAGAWTRPNVVRFYATHRNKKSDLHVSEAYFLSKLLRKGIRVLDVGCAVGGFCALLRELQPDVQYTGVDISETMISEARRRYPDSRFEVSRADRLPFQNGEFDLVLCTGGTLPMILAWRDVLQECWRVTKERALFDIRVVAEGEDVEDMARSYVKLAFAGQWDGRAIAPYVIITMASLHQAIRSLKPDPGEIRGYGYYHAVSEMAVTAFDEVCMTTFCVGKTSAAIPPGFEWQVPIPWPHCNPTKSTSHTKPL